MRTKKKVAQIELRTQAPTMPSDYTIRADYCDGWYNDVVIAIEVIYECAVNGSEPAFTALRELAERAISDAVRVTEPGKDQPPHPAPEASGGRAAYNDISICMDACDDRASKGDLIALDILQSTARYMVARCARELCSGIAAELSKAPK